MCKSVRSEHWEYPSVYHLPIETLEYLCVDGLPKSSRTPSQCPSSMPAHSDHATQDMSVSKGGKLHIRDTYTLLPFEIPHTQRARQNIFS